MDKLVQFYTQCLIQNITYFVHCPTLQNIFYLWEMRDSYLWNSFKEQKWAEFPSSKLRLKCLPALDCCWTHFRSQTPVFNPLEYYLILCAQDTYLKYNYIENSSKLSHSFCADLYVLLNKWTKSAFIRWRFTAIKIVSITTNGRTSNSRQSMSLG
jgi:hypothetical protein